MITLACAVVSATAAEQKADDDTWRQIASSDIVAIGELAFNQVKGTDDYVVLEFTAQKFLKSSVPTKKLLKVRFYDRKKEHGNTIEYLERIATESVLIFIVQVDDPAVEGLYLANALKDSIREASQAFEDSVDRELKLQKKIAQDFKSDRAMRHFAKVEGILASIKDSDSQHKAFSRLEALGKKGVPAIIAQMDDFRELPDSSMSLKNPPGHREGFRHYGPDIVVDALSAILNQITRHSFRSIYNGGSERERRACINAWRVYLHHTRNGA